MLKRTAQLTLAEIAEEAKKMAAQEALRGVSDAALLEMPALGSYANDLERRLPDDDLQTACPARPRRRRVTAIAS